MLKHIGNTPIQENHQLSCHCGAVVIELHVPNGLEMPTYCDCSLCRRKGAMIGHVTLENLKIIKGQDALTLYQFKTNTAKHYFCKHCGIYTHHQRRSDPNQFGFNMGCLEGVNPFDIADVPVHDGVNHPADFRK